jgi:hypothetical protein
VDVKEVLLKRRNYEIPNTMKGITNNATPFNDALVEIVSRSLFFVTVFAAHRPLPLALVAVYAHLVSHVLVESFDFPVPWCGTAQFTRVSVF